MLLLFVKSSDKLGMKRPLGQSGFSLIEIVIASVILSIIVGSSLTFMSNTSTQDTFRGKIQQDNSCLAEANKLLANIKDRGQARRRLNLPRAKLLAGSYTFTSAVDPSIGDFLSTDINSLVDTNDDGIFTNDNDFAPVEPGIPHAHRWPVTVPYRIYSGNTASDDNIVRPHLLIMGYMNTLQAMYNSNPGGFCGATGLQTYNDNTIIIQPTANLNQAQSAPAPTARLRIQPFNTQTGATAGCGAVNIRPAGPRENTITARRTSAPPSASPVADPFHPIITNPVNNEIFDPDVTASTDLGFIVTSTVTYTDRKGSLRRCSVQEKFQYNAQPENSQTLEIHDTDQVANPASGSRWSGGPINDIDDGVRDINGTVRTQGVANPPVLSDGAAANTVFLGCGEAATNHARSVNFRMTRTRPGSVHMCRDLSFKRHAQRRTSPALNGTYDYAHTSDLTNSTGGTYPASGAQSGFIVRFSEGSWTTFRSHEVMRHPYFRARGQSTGKFNNLVIGGLYYPRTHAHTDIAPTGPGSGAPTSYSAGGYYCINGAGCGGINDTSITPAQMVERALPHLPLSYGTWRASPTFDVRNFITIDEVDHAIDGSRNWGPCETLTVNCPGATVDISQFEPGNNSNSQLDAYHILINHLPVGCEVHVQIAEVDAGYNIRATEVREYIQEPQLGNRLCRKGLSDNKFTLLNNDYRGKWFFACTSIYTPANGGWGAVPNCSAATSANTDCCFPYPDFPLYSPSE